MTATELQTQALAMPPEERAALLQALLSSLNAQTNEDTSALWAQHAECRLEKQKTIPVSIQQETSFHEQAKSRRGFFASGKTDVTSTLQDSMSDYGK